MNADSFITQGLYFLYKDPPRWYCIDFTLHDPIDPELLQQALDAVLDESNYFNLHFVQKSPVPQLSMTRISPAVCRKSPDNAATAQSDGMLFYLACQENTISLGFDHFLTDGIGSAKFLTQIAAKYCNLKYHSSFPSSPAQVEADYPLEKTVPNGQPPRPSARRGSVVLSSGNPVRRHYIRICREDLIREAIQQSVKPFSLLLSLVIQVYSLISRKENITFSFPVNVRGAIDEPTAPYNACVCFCSAVSADAGSERTLTDSVNQTVLDNLQQECQRYVYARCMSDALKLHQKPLPYGVKLRAMDMLEDASETADVFVSYIGNPLIPHYDGIEEYIADSWWEFSDPQKCEIGIEAISINGSINLAIIEQTGHPSFADIFSEHFHSANIAAEILANNAASL